MGKVSFLVIFGIFISLKESSINNAIVNGQTTASNLRRNLKYYELLKAVDLTHHIVKRGANPSNHPLNHIKELQFKTLGR